MKPSSHDRVRTFYESCADGYAEMMDAEINLPVYADILSRLAGRLADVSGPVLDTSCGSGHMLARYRERYDSRRALVGVDLSPRMVAIAADRLGDSAEMLTADMRDLRGIPSGSIAAVLSFFAIHHIDARDAVRAIREWYRVLCPGGQLALATWEGEGAIDYGDTTDVVALRYSREEIEAWAGGAGFTVDRCVVESVEGMPMDAVYLEATRS